MYNLKKLKKIIVLVSLCSMLFASPMSILAATANKRTTSTSKPAAVSAPKVTTPVKTNTNVNSAAPKAPAKNTNTNTPKVDADKVNTNTNKSTKPDVKAPAIPDKGTPPATEEKPKEATPAAEEPTEPTEGTGANKPVVDPWQNVKGFSDLLNSNLFSGEVEFKLPLSLPAGRNNFGPNLDLTYSSFNRNFTSAYGLGFDLSVSSIYRTSAHGIDKMYDRNDFAVKLAGKYDELVLVDAATNLYQDKNGSSFNKYFFDKINNSWSVVDTSGTTYYFGKTARQADPNNSSHTFSWFLEEAVSLSGDKIKFSYWSDKNQVYPVKIEYGILSDGSYLYQVDLTYSAKATGPVWYQTQFGVSTNYALTSVAVKYRDYNLDPNSFTTAREYVLIYNDLNQAAVKLQKIEERASGINLPPVEFEYYTDTAAVNLLKKIKNNRGGEINLAYMPSTAYKNPTTSKRSPLPFIIKTLSRIEYVDLINNVTQAKTFAYYDGHYFVDYQNIFSREYAGFRNVIETDNLGYVTKYYFHQSQFAIDNPTSAPLGEFEDNIAKKSRLWRQEVFDNAGKLVKLNLTKWQRSVLGGTGETERNFVYPEYQVDVNYSSDGSYLATAQKSEYDFTTGNLVKESNFGQVTVNPAPGSGSIYDTIVDTDGSTGNDTIIAVYDYAKPQVFATNLTGAKSQTTLYQRSVSEGNKFKQSRNYYDGLAWNLVSKGNSTKQEDWLSADYGAGQGLTSTVPLVNQNRYVVTQIKTYGGACGALGLPDSVSDALGNKTSLKYDIACKFATEVTAPTTQNQAGQNVNHVEKFSYDYASGQVKQKIDENGNIWQKNYDSLGRVVAEYVPNPQGATPEDLILKTKVTYQDNYNGSLSAPLWTLSAQRDHEELNESDDNAWHFSYEYYDGFGRKISDKKEAENNQWIAAQYAYDSRGRLAKQSLPYFSGTSAFENNSGNWNNLLYSTFEYDALNRPVATKKILAGGAEFGHEQIVYSPGVETHYDLNNNKKVLHFDARGQLIAVKEYNRADKDGNATSDFREYTVSYVYDSAGNLTKMIDAEGNVREWRFDSFGRRIAMTELHYPNLTVWNTDFALEYYAYDDNSNLIGKRTFAGEEIIYTYDALNRLIQENSQSTSFVDQENFYDESGATNYGIGKLSQVIARNALGEGVKYQSVSDVYEYDRLGGVTRLMVNITKDDGVTFDKGYTKETTYDVLGREKTTSYNNGDFGVWYEYNNGLNTEKIGKKLLNGAQEVVVLNIDYTADGRVARQENANGAVITNTYDPNQLNRLTQKTTVLSSGEKLEDFTYVYDLVGNILEQRVGGDVGYPAVNIYGYDDLYRLVKVISTSSKDEKDNYEQNYKYSPVGNIWYKSDQGDYSYPATTPTNGPSLNPEAVVSISLNNIVRKQFGYDLRGNVNTHKNFDESGKLLTDTSYTWDYRNRLTYGAVNDVALGKTSGYYFSYDYAGQRVLKSNADKSHLNYYPFEGFEEEIGDNGYKKTYSIAIGADETVKQMFSSEKSGGIFIAAVREDESATSPWLDWLNPPVEPQLPVVINEIQEKRETIDVSEQTSEENVVPDATSQIEPIASAVTTQDENVCKEVKLVSGMYYFYGDHLGSSSVVTDSGGKVVQSVDYYPFGGIRHEYVDSTFENDYLYTGKEFDEELGVYYYGARYYMADVGRWMGEDPMVLDFGAAYFKEKYGVEVQRMFNDVAGFNVYAYANNNPLKYVDPDGNSSILAIALGVIGMVFFSDIESAQAPGLNTPIGNQAVSKDIYELTMPIYDGLPNSVKFIAPFIWGGATQKLQSGATKFLDKAVIEGISKKYNWGLANTLERHFKEHGSDFGAETMEDYAKKAMDFFSESQSNNLPTKIDKSGIIRIFDFKSGTFGSYNPDGTTKTLFKPVKDDLYKYWESQPGKVIQEGGGL